jgi:hypothetical protein
MKYFKGTDNTQNDVEKIVGEIINITTGLTYFNNGVLLDVPKKGHNKYTIDSVEYDVRPTYGVVIVWKNPSSSVLNMIDSKCAEMYATLQAKHGNVHIIPGAVGSTQYLLMTNNTKTDGLTSVGFIKEPTINLSTIGANYNFIWNITDTNLIPVSNYNAKKFNVIEKLSSLSAIIYDCRGALDLPDGFRSADYPDVSNFIAHKNQLVLNKEIYLSARSGITLEIAHLNGYNDVNKNIFVLLKHDLHFAKWSDIEEHIYERIENNLSFTEQINKGLLDFSKPTKSVKPTKSTKITKTTAPVKSTKSVKPTKSTKITKTTAPVKSTKSVKPTKPTGLLRQYKAREDTKIHDDRINADNEQDDQDDRDEHDTVINTKTSTNKTNTNKTSTSKTNTDTGKDTNTGKTYKCFITGIPIYEDCYVLDIYSRIVEEIIPEEELDDYLSLYPNTEVIDKEKEEKENIKTKTTKKITNYYNNTFATDGLDINEVKRNMLDTIQFQYEEEEKKLSSRKKSTKKKKTNANSGEIKVRRELLFNKPRCILVSPFFVHYMHKKKYIVDPKTGLGDNILVFEQMTKTKTTLYRTFCPVTLKQTIDQLDISDLHKKVLHFINQGKLTLSSTCNMAMSDSNIESIKPTTNHLLNSSDGKIKFINALEY